MGILTRNPKKETDEWCAAKPEIAEKSMKFVLFSVVSEARHSLNNYISPKVGRMEELCTIHLQWTLQVVLYELM